MNQGSAPADRVEVRSFSRRKSLYVSSHSNPKLYETPFPAISIPLLPDASVKLKQNVFPGTSPEEWALGEYTLRITVDPDDKVDESNETNNTMSFKIKVIEPVVSVELKPVIYAGPCPKNHITVAKASIKMERGKTDVKWQWLYGWEGASSVKGSVHTIQLKRGEVQNFDLLSAAIMSVTGWAQIKILSPKKILSNKIDLQVTCLNNLKRKKK
jgi:hypothetical protein